MTAWILPPRQFPLIKIILMSDHQKNKIHVSEQKELKIPHNDLCRVEPTVRFSFLSRQLNTWNFNEELFPQLSTYHHGCTAKKKWSVRNVLNLTFLKKEASRKTRALTKQCLFPFISKWPSKENPLYDARNRFSFYSFSSIFSFVVVVVVENKNHYAAKLSRAATHQVARERKKNFNWAYFWNEK